MNRAGRIPNAEGLVTVGDEDSYATIHPNGIASVSFEGGAPFELDVHDIDDLIALLRRVQAASL